MASMRWSGREVGEVLGEVGSGWVSAASPDLFPHLQNGASGTCVLDNTLHIKHEPSRAWPGLDAGAKGRAGG